MRKQRNQRQHGNMESRGLHERSWRSQMDYGNIDSLTTQVPLRLQRVANFFLNLAATVITHSETICLSLATKSQVCPSK